MTQLTVPVLFTLGEVLAVFLAEDASALAQATCFRRTVAGSESNVAAGVVRLGMCSRLLTCVGRDPMGDAVAATLAHWGIDAVIERSESRHTGVLIRGLAQEGPAQAVNLRQDAAATELSPGWVDQAWLPQPAVVFLTGITAVRSPTAQAAAVHAAERGRSEGALIVVDPNLRPSLGSPGAFRSALGPLAALTDVAIGDRLELSLLANACPDSAVRSLLASGCRLVVEKRGALGAWATDGRSEWEVASCAATVVDTVGAGDAFAAGLIASVAAGKSVPGSLALASEVAAAVVATAGDVEGFPAGLLPAGSWGMEKTGTI